MKELALKYGCNPNQKPSRVYMAVSKGTEGSHIAARRSIVQACQSGRSRCRPSA